MTKLPLLWVLACTCCFAQPADEAKPASTNVPGAAFPKLDTEGRGSFQLKDPNAQTLAVQLPQGRYEMAMRRESGASSLPRWNPVSTTIRFRSTAWA